MDERPAPAAAPEPGPPVTVHLPDGQSVTAYLRGRWQSREGQWFYDVTLPLWAHAVVRGRDVAEPADTHFCVPATHVSPRPDASYRGVPIRRHPAVITRARTGRPAPVTEEASGRWSVEPLRFAYTSSGPRPVAIHHETCWRAATIPPTLTTDEAREALAWPGGRGCDVCRSAERLAQPAPRPPHG
ncbi:DUF6233 domain-containing protein [Streptomyces sp. URMC 123]|uniref:DUF6233 domain-containing protein n=1 Tax=Streptomyces sp. URMC 123 TaxID=3423403 RepID=UPI003F1CBA7E